MFKLFTPLCLILCLASCGASSPWQEASSKNKGTTPVLSQAERDKLKQVLDSQPESAKARYKYRHPFETLDFIGVKPGQIVVEALPGGGWYSSILGPYLGKHCLLYTSDAADE